MSENSCEHPQNYGLSNSEPIIPSYYLKKIKFLFNDKEIETSYLDIDFFDVVKDDIRNIRKLNKYQLEYIKKLSHDEKFEIINLMNETITTVSEILTETS